MASDDFISEADELMNKLNSMTDSAAKDIEFDTGVSNKSALDVNWADAATSDEDAEDVGEEHKDVEMYSSSITNKQDKVAVCVQEKELENEMINAEDLEKMLLETMNSKPTASVGKIKKVDDVADIPVVPFKKVFVPMRAPKTVLGQYQEPLMARPSSDHKGYKKKYRRIQRNTGGKGKKKGGRRYVNEDSENNSRGDRTRKFKVDASNPTAVSGDKFDENIGGYVSDGENGEPTLFVNTFKDLDDEEAVKLWQRKISKAERLRREGRNMANNLKRLGIQYHKSDLKHESPLSAGGNESPGRKRGKNFRKTIQNNNSLGTNNARSITESSLGWYGNYTPVTLMLQYFLPIFVFTVIIFNYYGSPIVANKHNRNTNDDSIDEIINNVQLNFFHPVPVGTIGLTQQPTAIVVDFLGYNEFLSKYYDADKDKKIPAGKFTVWIDGNETASEIVTLPILDDERQEVYRWRAVVQQTLYEKKHLVRVVYEINGVKFSNATTFTIVPDPPNPKVSIITPAKGQVLALHGSEKTTVQWRTDNFVVPRDGYLRIALNDGEPKIQDYAAPFVAEIDKLTPGKHKFSIALLSRFNEGKILHQDEVVFHIIEKKSASSTSLGELELLKAMPTSDLEYLLEDEDHQLNSLRREIIEKILDARWKEDVQARGL